jgi:hypothetical protein
MGKPRSRNRVPQLSRAERTTLAVLAALGEADVFTIASVRQRRTAGRHELRFVRRHLETLDIAGLVEPFRGRWRVRQDAGQAGADALP